jgi:hypothetical protein
MARKMLNCELRRARPGDDVFSRQMALIDAVARIYASAAEFFALDKLFGPDHYRAQTRTRRAAAGNP